MNIYDVLRSLVRQTGHGSPQAEQDLLLTVDAAEQGYSDLDSYKAALEQKRREEAAQAQAATSAPAEPADVTAAISDDELQAELDRRKALANAQTQTTPGLTRTAPIPTS